MKKRIIALICFILIGLIAIEIYIRQKSPKDYYLMDYTINYEVNVEYPEKLLLKGEYIDYYFTHYDENSSVKFASGDVFSIQEALNNNYILLGDILNKIDITKKANFTLEFHQNEQDVLVRKYFLNNLNVFYYEINDIKVKNDNKNENMLELLENNKLDLDTIILYLKQEFKEDKEDLYTVYTKDDLKIYLKETNIYFGSKNLNLEIIKKDEEMR